MTWDRESGGTSLCSCKELTRQGLGGGGRKRIDSKELRGKESARMGCDTSRLSVNKHGREYHTLMKLLSVLQRKVGNEG